MQKNKDFIEYRKQWELATKREILTNVPLHLDIELTNICNLDCKMCWQNSEMTYKKGSMDFYLFKKIIDEAVTHGVKAIKMQSRGESALYTYLFDAIIYAKKRGILDIQLTTNATLFNKNNIDKFLSSGLDLLIISIDEDHIESYERLHKNEKYEVISKNILNLLKIKKERYSNLLKIRLQISSGTKELNPAIMNYRDVFEKYVDSFQISNYFLLNDSDKKIENPKKSPCSYPWQRMVINYDGLVTVCCKDFNCSMIMGDVKNNSLQEIWNSKEYINFRDMHISGKRDKIDFCRICNL